MWVVLIEPLPPTFFDMVSVVPSPKSKYAACIYPFEYTPEQVNVTASGVPVADETSELSPLQTGAVLCPGVGVGVPGPGVGVGVGVLVGTAVP